jgi:hypothetical protein
MRRSILFTGAIAILLAGCGQTPHPDISKSEPYQYLSSMDITASDITLDCYNERNDHFAITVIRTDELVNQDINKLCTKLGEKLYPHSSQRTRS